MNDVVYCNQCLEDVEIDPVSGCALCPACNPESYYSDDPFMDDDGVIGEIDFDSEEGMWP